MAGQVRKLIQPSTRLKQLRVPERYAKGVGTERRFIMGDDGKMKSTMVRGASETAVTSSADDIALRTEDALARWKAAKEAGEGVNAAIKPLDEMAELVKTVADTHAREPDTVTANVAAALLALSPEDRMTVLRRAGRPSVFEPLLEGDLAEPPLGGIGDDPAEAQAYRKSLARARVNEEGMLTGERGSLPLVQRPSSMFVSPDKTSKRGRPVKSSQTFKEHLPKAGNSPLDVQAKRGDSPVHGALIKPGSKEITPRDPSGIRRWPTVDAAPRGGSGGLTQEDIDFFGMTPAPASSQKQAANRLAGDQIAQAKAIEKKGGTPTLPMVVRSRKKDGARAIGNSPAAITTGASQRPGGKWSGKSSALEIEDEVARRNRSAYDKAIAPLYEKTAPTSSEAAGRGKNAPLRAVSPTDTVVDLDQSFPWWRARFATMDSRGRYYYPARLPTAEFVTGMIQGLFQISDPNFMSRVAPLIQRSIDAAPDIPMSERASAYGQKVFLLSPEMEQAMRKGVGSPDYPYPVYGERTVPRERVSKPARTFAEQYGKEAVVTTKAESDARSRVKQEMQGGAEKPVDQQSLDAKIRAARERVKQQMRGPGTNDFSSINTVPEASPVRFLLA